MAERAGVNGPNQIAVPLGTILSSWQTEELMQTQTNAKNNHTYVAWCQFCHTADG